MVECRHTYRVRYLVQRYTFGTIKRAINMEMDICRNCGAVIHQSIANQPKIKKIHTIEFLSNPASETELHDCALSNSNSLVLVHEYKLKGDRA